MKKFLELIGELAGLGKDATASTLEKARGALQGYFSFLKKASIFFVVFLAFVAVVFLFGALFESRPVKGLAVFLGGMAALLWGMAAFPIVWAVQKGLEWESLRKTFQTIGAGTLWILFLSLYFYFIPVPLTALPMVMALTAALAIASVVFGVGITPRFLAARAGTVLVIVTVLFLLTALMPGLPSGAVRMLDWFNKQTETAVSEATTPKPQPVVLGPDVQFFNPRTGQPTIWYYKAGEGRYELFNSPGYHPRTGKELEPANEQVVRELEKLAAQQAETQREEDIRSQRLAELESVVKRSEEAAASAAGSTGPPRVAEPVRPAEESGPPGREAIRSDLDLNRYCATRGFQTVVNRDGTGYGWRCIPGNVSIDVNQLCLEQFGAQYRAFLTSPPPGMPGDWRCRTN